MDGPLSRWLLQPPTKHARTLIDNSSYAHKWATAMHAHYLITSECNFLAYNLPKN